MSEFLGVVNVLIFSAVVSLLRPTFKAVRLSFLRFQAHSALQNLPPAREQFVDFQISVQGRSALEPHQLETAVLSAFKFAEHAKFSQLDRGVSGRI